MTEHYSHQRAYQEFCELLSTARVKADPATCLVYGYDNSRRQALADFVVFPRNAAEVAAIIKICRTHQLPIIARGQGTNTTGATVPLSGGVIISCEQFAKILKVDVVNRILITEPGATNAAIQQAAAAHGFFWAPDPGSANFSTVGGNIACNAAGPRALKYGTTRENTLALHAVTGAGELIATGSITTKNAVGYDLTRLLVGSEGTLAIITEATLKLIPQPQLKQSVRAFFTSSAAAVSAISAILATPFLPYAIEYLDAKALEILREHDHLAIPTHAHSLLLIDVVGEDAQLHAELQYVLAALQVQGLITVEVAADETRASLFWQARKALSPALRTLAPNKINEDVVVPLSALAEFIEFCEALAAAQNILIVNFGHGGNGNLHVNILFNTENPGELEKAQTCLTLIFEKVIALGGSLSGEHGIGVAKKEFISLQIASAEIALMRAIKKVFDPDNLLNPGKIF